MGRILEALEKEERTRVILLTGSGDHTFSAGADMMEFGQLDGGPHEAMRRVHALFRKIEHYSKPIVAVVNGRALGGGNELQMVCHLAFASDRAEFGLPEVRRGIIPGYGGTQRLARLIGKRRALFYLMTGQSMSAAEAKSCGLINEVFPHEQLRDSAMAFAVRLARQSAPLAVAGVLRAVGRGMECSFEDGLTVESEELMRLIATEDAVEGIQAFFEKREPLFNGR
jgi:enoyl-CoA hydratase